jgi:hypothetical protein
LRDFFKVSSATNVRKRPLKDVPNAKMFGIARESAKSQIGPTIKWLAI